MDRVAIVHEALRTRASEGDFPAGKAPAGPLAAHDALAIYHAQCLSRALDRESRAMQQGILGITDSEISANGANQHRHHRAIDK